MNTSFKYKQFDAVLAAGEGTHSYKVMHQHKAFLDVHNHSVISYVVRALQGAECVRNIYIVGMRDELKKNLRHEGIDFHHPKPIHLLEQRENLYQNVWYAYKESLPEPVEDDRVEQAPYYDKAILVVPCDSPFITSHEIDYFAAHADMENYDYVLGLTSEKDMRPFYPRKEHPGIKMAYLHLKEDKYRLNNLHLIKPARVHKRHYIQTMYQYRYQRDIKNVLRFGTELFIEDTHNGYRFYVCLLLSLMFARMKMGFLVDWVRRFVPKAGIERWVSSGLDTRFMGLVSPLPGATLDIDNNRDYEVIKLQFHNWKQYLETLKQKYPLARPQPANAPEAHPAQALPSHRAPTQAR